MSVGVHLIWYFSPIFGSSLILQNLSILFFKRHFTYTTGIWRNIFWHGWQSGWPKIMRISGFCLSVALNSFSVRSIKFVYFFIVRAQKIIKVSRNFIETYLDRIFLVLYVFYGKEKSYSFFRKKEVHIASSQYFWSSATTSSSESVSEMGAISLE